MLATTNLPADQLQARFLALVPKIQTHAQIVFRSVACPHKRQDRIAEAVALGYLWFLRLARRGRPVEDFPSAFCTFLARAVKSGRKLTGMSSVKDVMNERCQQRNHFRMEALPATTRSSHEELYGLVGGQYLQDCYEERLRDNQVTPPPDAAAFRIDFPQFLAGLAQRDRDLAQRDRDLAEFLSLGHSATRAATRFNLAPGRVTQLRQAWCRRWRAGQGEDGASQEAAAERGHQRRTAKC